MFRSDRFADVSLNQWMALTPPELVKAHLNIDDRTLAALSKDKRIITAPATDRGGVKDLCARSDGPERRDDRTAPSMADPITQLERLAALRDKGILTPAEFEAARVRQVKRLTADGS